MVLDADLSKWIREVRSLKNPYKVTGGGGAPQVSLDDRSAFTIECPVAQRGVDFILLDSALTALGEFDPRKARLLELRYFGGMSVQESAEALGISW